MIHPDTELRPVHPRVGLGVVATRRIPKGTITWVHDALDQTFTAEQFARLGGLFHPMFDKYAYRDGAGRYVLCWDHGRFVNHSCHPTCMAPGFDFEVAIRDIEPGEELTGDYATYNLETGFECHCGAAKCRRRIDPFDRLSLAPTWDAWLHEALMFMKSVAQPLWPLVREKRDVEIALSDRSRIPSCRTHFFDREPLGL